MKNSPACTKNWNPKAFSPLRSAVILSMVAGLVATVAIPAYAASLPAAETMTLQEMSAPDNQSLVVDPTSLAYLQGTLIDFDDGLHGKGFEVRNPNATSTCGCGKSFS